MKKRFICFLMSFSIFSLFVFDCAPVSAALSFPVPDDHYKVQGLFDENTYKKAIFDLYENPTMENLGFTSLNTDIMIYHDPDNKDFVIYVFNSEKSVVWSLPDYNDSSKTYLALSAGDVYLYGRSSDLSTLTSAALLPQNDYNDAGFVMCYDSSFKLYFPAYRMYSNGWKMYQRYNYDSLIYTHNFENMYNPVILPIYEAVYSLSIEKEQFVRWLIDNQKYVEIADSLVENRVSGFVDIFQRYGANTKAFTYNVKQFFEFIGIGQTVSDYAAVLEKTRSLYREYQRYVRQQLIDHYNNKVKDTLNIKPVTNDNNTSLITDSADDTVVVRLLRDILRSLISLPVNIGDLIRTLEVKVDGLDNSVIIANDGGSSDLSVLWTYSSNDFDDDLLNFSSDVSEVQQLPLQYLTNINENPLMPEKMLSDKDNLTVNIPNISGFTVSDNGNSFSTQTTSYVLSSVNYPWLDSLVKKIKRFSGILLIIGYLVSLRYRLPEIVRGE